MYIEAKKHIYHFGPVVYYINRQQVLTSMTGDYAGGDAVTGQPIDQAVRRMLDVKLKRRLFDQPADKAELLEEAYNREKKQ